MIRRVRMTVATLKKQMDRRFRSLRQHMDGRFARIDDRFRRIDVRFRRIDERFRGVDKRFVAIDAQFEAIHDKLDTVIRIQREQFDHLVRITSDHERRLRDLEARR